MYFTLKSKDIENNKKFISSYTFEQKKSKFISYIFSIANANEANKCIEIIKKENKDARHVVYIYSFLADNNIPQINFSDDGEPQGTGTKAIYELLTKEHITNLCIVIVRYFGGVLLGAGPLARAYLNSTRGAIDLCKKDKILNYIEKTINIEYSKYNLLKNDLKEFIAKKYVIIEKTEFNETILLELKIEESSINRVEETIYKYIY